jgi:hypothetical protein
MTADQYPHESFARRLVFRTAVYLSAFLFLVWMFSLPIRNAILESGGITFGLLLRELGLLLAAMVLVFLFAWGAGHLAARALKRRHLQLRSPKALMRRGFYRWNQSPSAQLFMCLLGPPTDEAVLPTVASPSPPRP